MSDKKYWISDEQIKLLLMYVHLEDEYDAKKLLKKIQDTQKIKE